MTHYRETGPREPWPGEEEAKIKPKKSLEEELDEIIKPLREGMIELRKAGPPLQAETVFENSDPWEN